MKELFEILCGVHFKQPLTWKGRLAIIWIALAVVGLTINDDAPFWALALVVVNFFASLLAGAMFIPDIEDE